jgi:hypothetical protein
LFLVSANGYDQPIIQRNKFRHVAVDHQAAGSQVGPRCTAIAPEPCPVHRPPAGELLADVPALPGLITRAEAKACHFGLPHIVTLGGLRD